MTWQPIETAPKDGTRFLVYWPTHDELDCSYSAHIGVAWKRPDGQITCDAFVLDPDDPAWASANFGHNMPFILIMAAIGVVRFFSGVVELLRMLDTFVINTGPDQ